MIQSAERPAAQSNKTGRQQALSRPDACAVTRTSCATVRRALPIVLSCAGQAAQDLKNGMAWSDNLSRFETLSMNQAQILASLPVRRDDAKFGLLVRQASFAYIAFREMVRRDIIGGVHEDIDDAEIETTLRAVEDRATLASARLQALETALTEG